MRPYYIFSFLLVLLFSLGGCAIIQSTGPGSSGTWKEPVAGISFVFVEGGCFQMGCDEWQINCNEEEKPPHEVCLDNFWIGKYEVTQGQWEKVMVSNPSDYQEGPNYPVEMVSWNDTQEFISKLNSSSKVVIYRLPTEAEWEFAARSRGEMEIYSGGNSEQEGFWHPYRWEPGMKTYPDGQTFSVGTAKPNGLDLYDMSGNVMEWCQDWYQADYYQNSPVDNPRGPDSGSQKVTRGGNIPGHNRLSQLRTTSRNPVRPEWSDFATGFRLVLTPTPAE